MVDNTDWVIATKAAPLAQANTRNLSFDTITEAPDCLQQFVIGQGLDKSGAVASAAIIAGLLVVFVAPMVTEGKDHSVLQQRRTLRRKRIVFLVEKNQDHSFSLYKFIEIL